MSYWQEQVYCLPNNTACSTALATDTFGCGVSCTGLYADVYQDNIEEHGQDYQTLSDLQDAYKTYKSNFAKNIAFNQDKDAILGKYIVFTCCKINNIFCPADELEFAPL